MKIDDSVKKTTGLAVGTTQTRSSKGAEKASVSKAPSDSVHISSQLQTLAGQVSSAGVFDAKKVEKIKAAIADGHFQVNADKVADGLIDTVKDLIHSRKA